MNRKRNGKFIKNNSLFNGYNYYLKKKLWKLNRHIKKTIKEWNIKKYEN